MPRRSRRSRTFRRIFVKLPGGTTALRYKRRKPSPAECANCGKNLAGVPRDIPSKIHNLPKTKKRPERPFGGMFCSRCSRAKILEMIRK